MATSGSLDTNKVGNFYFTITWTRTGYSSAENKHYISYSVTAHNTAGNYRTVYLKSLNINGTNYYYNTTGTRYYDGDTVTFGNATISSSNDAGDGILSISFEAGVGIASGSNSNGTGSWALDRIPRQANIISAPDFNDEENPTITYSNPAGNSVDSLQACISLTGSSADISYRDISKTGTSYTFNLTTAERTLLRQATTGNSRTVIFYVKTIISGTTFYSTLQKTMTIINGNPTFSTFTYEDTELTALALTGNNQIIINDCNIVQITISTANKAIANKEATMVKYRAVCGSLSIEEDYSSNSDVVLTLPYITNRTITVYAIDSRGNSTEVSITISASNWKDYTEPIIRTGKINRQNGVNTQTILQFSGNIWATEDEYDFGAVENSITGCYYQYKETTDSEYSSPISITPTLNSNGSFSFNSPIAGDLGANGFDLSKSYNIEIFVIDATANVSEYEVLLGVGKPAMAMHKNGVGFGLPYNVSVGGALQKNGKEVLALSNTTFLTTPLTNSNLEHTDTEISNAKLIIVYFTFMYSSSKYRDSVIIPVDDTEWYQVNDYRGNLGYIKIVKSDNKIITSQYSDNLFAVLGYTIIS